MTIVIECQIWILTEIVVVAGVQVPGSLSRLLVIVDQLEDWQGVVDAGQEDQIEEQFRPQLQKIGEIFNFTELFE